MPRVRVIEPLAFPNNQNPEFVRVKFDVLTDAGTKVAERVLEFPWGTPFIEMRDAMIADAQSLQDYIIPAVIGQEFTF